MKRVSSELACLVAMPQSKLDKRLGALLNILLVEDDEDLVFLLSNMFTTIKGMSTTVCTDVDDALKTLTGDYLPDVALIDFRAGGKTNSIELCKAIRERRHKCQIFMMSGVAREFMESATRDEIDIQGYLEKPFNIGKLLSRLKRLTEGEEEDKSGRSKTLGLTHFPPSTSEQIDTYYSLLDQHPKDTSVRQLLAFSLYTAGRFAEALKEYNEVINAGVSSFLIEYYSGHTCARLFRYDDAISRWEKAMKMAPTNEVVERVKTRINAAIEMKRMQKRMMESGPFRKLDI